MRGTGQDDPPTTAVRCSCGRRARYFGYFAGGVCLEHAMSMLDMFPDGMSQFRPEHRDELTIRRDRRPRP